MDVVIRLKGAEVSKLPYMLIAETTSRSIWNTGRRTRKMEMEFTSRERKEVANIIQMSKRWAIHGAPIKVEMDSRSMILWKRLGNFCSEL